MSKLQLTLVLIAVSVISAEERPVLQVPGYGTLRGETGRSEHLNRTYYGFHTLYYAKAPTEANRFLPAEPVDPMPEDEIYDAGLTRVECVQGSSGTENCLIVNVYTPKLPMNYSDGETYDELLPVMYWIHGGSFSSGQIVIYTPWKLMDWDVVLVEVQYRLGPLGFLSLDTDEVPGNAGIFDQIEGLRWVNQFIKYFGGDPDCVTVFGESAGGASVTTLLLAPQAQGLFHRAIAESGAILAEWSLDRDSVRHSRRIAELAGCPLEPYEDLLQCLRTIDPNDLAHAYDAFENEDRLKGGLGFGGSSPVIQKAGAQRIIQKEPVELMEAGEYNKDVPVIFGANRQDGSYVMGVLYDDFLTPNNLLNDTHFFKYDMIPTLLKAVGIRDDSRAVADALYDKYLKDADMEDFDSLIHGLIDVCSVMFFKAAGYRTAQLHSKHNPEGSYWYSFDFEGRYTMSLFLFWGDWPPIPYGIGHADELLYIFTFPELLMNETEIAHSRKMLQLWTTFAKYGNPTPEGVEMLEGIPQWPAYTDDNPVFMSLDKDLTVKYDYTEYYTVTGDVAYNRTRSYVPENLQSGPSFQNVRNRLYDIVKKKFFN